MQTVQVERRFDAPIEKVFDVLSDHAGYAAFTGVTGAKLLRPGGDHPNGLGALREIRGSGVWFREEITRFERPARFDYQIRASFPPVEHQGGSLRFQRDGGGTLVTWTTTFRVPIPVLGGLLTRLAARRLRQGFITVLAEAEPRARRA